jgi:hypothetical protein
MYPGKRDVCAACPSGWRHLRDSAPRHHGTSISVRTYNATQHEVALPVGLRPEAGAFEEEARRVLVEIASEGGGSYLRAEFLGAAYGMLGDRDEAFRQLDRAFEERSAGLIYLHLDPLYDSLRDDPRHIALVKKIGLQ